MRAWLAALGALLWNTGATINGATASTLHAFAAGGGQLTVFALAVLGVDFAAVIALFFIYYVVRPRLVARLSESSEVL